MLRSALSQSPAGPAPALPPRGARGVSLAYVANRLDRPIAWFRANREDLEKRGFPAPLDMPGHPRWDAAAIELWFENQMPPHLKEISPAQTDAWTNTLKQRARDIAKGLQNGAAA